MTDIKYLVTAIIAIPLIILVALTVFHGLSANTRVPFEATVNNETVGTGAGTHTTTYDAKKDSITWIHNDTFNMCSSATECAPNVTYTPFDKASIVVGAGNITGSIKAVYTAYSAGGYDEFKKVYDQTLQGHKLGSMVPYVLIAMAVITVIIGAFGISKFI